MPGSRATYNPLSADTLARDYTVPESPNEEGSGDGGQ